MSSVGSSGPRKAAKVLACVNCQQRKKKCDRKSPCSICLKVLQSTQRELLHTDARQQNATCVPSTPAPPRRRRQPTKELLERMSRCEELLRQCLEQKAFEKKTQCSQQQQQQHYHDEPHDLERPASSSEGSVSSKSSPDTTTTMATEPERHADKVAS